MREREKQRGIEAGIERVRGRDRDIARAEKNNEISNDSNRAKGNEELSLPVLAPYSLLPY